MGCRGKLVERFMIFGRWYKKTEIRDMNFVVTYHHLEERGIGY